MKTLYLLLLIALAVGAYGQNATVSTFLDSPDADVDDAMALDSKGNLYGSNFAGTTVYKITPDGQSSPFVTGLSNPNGLAFDSNDNLYVVEYTGEAIHKYDIDGNLLQTFPISGFPSGLIKAYKSENMIFTTADFGNLNGNGVFELSTTDGTITPIFVGDPVTLPVGLAYGPSGVLYIGDYLDREIYRVTRQGDLEYVATVPAPDNFVPFLAFIAYAQGYLYGTVYGENKIYKINPRAIDDVEIYSGSTFGSMDGNLSEATYAFPGGIISNKSGNTLYISEFSGVGNIRKITNGKGNHSPNLTVTAHPNPATNTLNILLDAPAKSNFRIQIYDHSANAVFVSDEVADSKNFLKSISTSTWKPGFYVLTITNGEHRETRRIIIK